MAHGRATRVARLPESSETRSGLADSAKSKIATGREVEKS